MVCKPSSGRQFGSVEHGLVADLAFCEVLVAVSVPLSAFELALVNDNHIALGRVSAELVEVFGEAVELLTLLVVLDIGLVASHVRLVDVTLAVVVRDQDNDNIQVFVFGLDQVPQVFGLMVRSKDKNHPLHGSADLYPINFVDLEFFDVHDF